MLPSQRHVLLTEWVAFAAMVIDHAAKADVLRVPGWEIVGRIAFPLFALTFAHNAARYRRCNTKKLVLIGLLALPGMAYLSGYPWWEPNVMFAFPLGWLVFRFFADRQKPGELFLKPLALWICVGMLSLGPAYDVRGIAFIVTALGLFSSTEPHKRWWLAVGCYVFFASTLASTPEKILPVTALLAAVLLIVSQVPAGKVERDSSTWWNRAGFGKWYLVQAYGLGLMKFIAC